MKVTLILISFLKPVFFFTDRKCYSPVWVKYARFSLGSSILDFHWVFPRVGFHQCRRVSRGGGAGGGGGVNSALNELSNRDALIEYVSEKLDFVGYFPLFVMLKSANKNSFFHYFFIVYFTFIFFYYFVGNSHNIYTPPLEKCWIRTCSGILLLNEIISVFAGFAII